MSGLSFGISCIRHEVSALHRREWKSVAKNYAKFESARLFSGGQSFHEITGKLSSDIILKTDNWLMNFLPCCHVMETDRELAGISNKAFQRKNNIKKEHCSIWLWMPIFPCIRNIKDFAFWHRYSTLSKSLTFASFAVSYESFQALAAVFSLYIDTLSTNRGAHILAFTLVDV